MEPRSITRTDWLLIAALFALVLPLRIWLLCNTEVTARDSIGYIRYALQFERIDEKTGERESYAEVLKKNHQHPGYPLLVLAMSQPVRAWDGEMTPDNMELSAQLVNLIASLLLILPMYFLGRQFFERSVSFGAALLYQYLPISAQHLSDGISEPVYLLLLVSGLLQMVHAVRDRSIARAVLCGMFTGLAYFTRPEGALILPTFGIVLIASQWRADWRSSWQRCLACLTAGAVTAALVGSPYYIATGTISNKPNIRCAPQVGSQGASPILFAATVARPGNEHGSPALLARSAWALGVEVNQGFHYAAGVPALLGFLWSFARLRRDVGFWALLLFAVLHGLILLRLGMVANYISDRHVMILVIGGVYFAVEGIRQLPERLLALMRNSEAAPRFAPLVSCILFVAILAICLPKATERLHGNRAANHEAGLWLASAFTKGDHIEDDHAWTFFFSGGVFREMEPAPVLPDGYVPTTWIVTTRSHDAKIAKQQGEAASARTPVKWWPESSDAQHARVLIYSEPRAWDKNRWTKSQQ